jgi:hypothetical protein
MEGRKMDELNQEFLPSYEPARYAVERARRIVKENNLMISRMKSESNIEAESSDSDTFLEAENFSLNDSYAFDLYKIKSSNDLADFIKNIFGVH